MTTMVTRRAGDALQSIVADFLVDDYVLEADASHSRTEDSETLTHV